MGSRAHRLNVYFNHSDISQAVSSRKPHLKEEHERTWSCIPGEIEHRCPHPTLVYENGKPRSPSTLELVPGKFTKRLHYPPPDPHTPVSVPSLTLHPPFADVSSASQKGRRGRP